jgi:hypothetical protein
MTQDVTEILVISYYIIVRNQINIYVIYTNYMVSDVTIIDDVTSIKRVNKVVLSYNKQTMREIHTQ